MIKKIAHFADIHLKDYKTEKEYREVFDNVYKSLEINLVDRIVIAGDLFHTKNHVKNETKLLAKEILNKLSTFAKVIIINGNHDGNPNNKEQLNSLETLIKLIDNNNIVYLNKSKSFIDENVQ
jgi:DNA repair exonuclease SbcCD nuclease subunit